MLLAEIRLSGIKTTDYHSTSRWTSKAQYLY